MLKARRESSNKLYDTYVLRWFTFCEQKQIDPFEADVKYILQFLQIMVTKGLKYTTVSTAKSALGTCIYITGNYEIAKHPDIKIFMKGVFAITPTQPKYTAIWDPDVVLDYFRKGPSLYELNMEELSKKLCMLIMLVTAQRPQILQSLKMNNFSVSQRDYVFLLQAKDIKQGRPSFNGISITLAKYPEETLCVFSHLKLYMALTEHVRKGEQQIMLTYGLPIHKASYNTMRRWLKDVLQEAGIDTKSFSAGSTRSAASSKASRANVPIEIIMNKCGWSQSSTFAKFYNKEFNKDVFAYSVLQK